MPRDEAAAHSRARAIGRPEGLHGDADEALLAQIANQRRGRVDIGGLQAMLEMDGHSRLARGDLDQRPVELMARDREDDLVGALPIGLQRRATLLMMNEPSAHRQQRFLKILEHTGHSQRMNASIRQRQVDGSARFGGSRARIGAAFVEFHGMAAALQQYREERPGGTRTDDANGGTRRAHWRAAWDKASTAA